MIQILNSFNAGKYASLFVGKRTDRFAKGVQFYVDGKPITIIVSEFSHLEQIISSNLDDKSDMLALKKFSVS